MPQTKIVKVGRRPLSLRVLRQMAGIVLRNGVIVYPTDTFYGLGACAFSARAVQKIYTLKQRDRRKPLSVVVSGIRMAEDLAVSLPPVFWKLSRDFWPGPLTIVIKSLAAFPPGVAGPGGTLALRFPALPWLLELVRQIDAPLTATSANLSGDKEVSDPNEAIRIFSGKVDLIIDGGSTPGGLPSTIVDITGKRPRILREGAIPKSRLRPYL